MREYLNILESLVLSEGGNIWKDDLSTTRINKQDVLPTVKFLEKIKLTSRPFIAFYLNI